MCSKYNFTHVDLLQEYIYLCKQMRSHATVSIYTYVSKSVHVNEALGMFYKLRKSVFYRSNFAGAVYIIMTSNRSTFTEFFSLS